MAHVALQRRSVKVSGFAAQENFPQIPEFAKELPAERLYAADKAFI
jgi:hypothetical protein